MMSPFGLGAHFLKRPDTRFCKLEVTFVLPHCYIKKIRAPHIICSGGKRLKWHGRNAPLELRKARVLNGIIPALVPPGRCEMVPIDTNVAYFVLTSPSANTAVGLVTRRARSPPPDDRKSNSSTCVSPCHWNRVQHEQWPTKMVLVRKTLGSTEGLPVHT